LDDMATWLYTANGTLPKLTFFNIEYTMRAMMNQQPEVKEFPQLFFEMMPALKTLLMAGNAIQPPYIEQFTSWPPEQHANLVIPPLKFISLASMASIDVNYLKAFVTVLKNRTEIPWEGFKGLELHHCPKIKAREAAELEALLGKKRFKWTAPRKLPSSFSFDLAADMGLGMAVGPELAAPAEGAPMQGAGFQINLGDAQNLVGQIGIALNGILNQVNGPVAAALAAGMPPPPAPAGPAGQAAPDPMDEDYDDLD